MRDCVCLSLPRKNNQGQVWGSGMSQLQIVWGHLGKPFNHGLVGSSLRFMPTAGPLAGALEEYLHKGGNVVEAALVHQVHCAGRGSRGQAGSSPPGFHSFD